MTDLEFITRVTHRVERQAQGMAFPPSTVFNIRNAALERLAIRIASDLSAYGILYRQYDLTLVAGEITLLSLDPTLLLLKEARRHWFVTMTGVRFPLQFLPSIRDLSNPPPTPDYYFYTFHNKKLVVRMEAGATPLETAVQLFGNYVPLLSDPIIDDELDVDIIDIAVAALLGDMNPEKVTQQAQNVSDTAPVN